MENHDEDRISKTYGVTKSKAAAALLFTIPGIPLIYAGQEVGETSMRGQIDWQRAGGGELFKFYQQLNTIRNIFSTFRSTDIKKISSSGSRIYAYLRPFNNQNGIAVINFSGSTAVTTITINESDLVLSDTLMFEKDYYLNDVLHDTSYVVQKSTLTGFQTELAPWGSRVFIFADSVIQNVNPVKGPNISPLPVSFRLFQNYPNPFNPITCIEYELAQAAQVVITIYDILGRKVIGLINENQASGKKRVRWDGKDERGITVGSGVYIYSLKAKSDSKLLFHQSRKMILIR
jgi:hypothetical protein